MTHSYTIGQQIADTIVEIHNERYEALRKRDMLSYNEHLRHIYQNAFLRIHKRFL